MSRLSQRYFPRKKRPKDEPAHYAFMFIRDIHTGIMPFRTGREYPFTVKLKRKNESLEEQIKDFLSIGRGAGWSITEELRDMVGTLSHYLVALGDIYIEIVQDGKSDKKSLAGKQLVILPRGKVLRVYKYYIQVVPFESWKRGEKKFHFIPSDNIWHLKLPKKLGSPSRHRRTLKKLNLLSNTTPAFVFEDGKLGGSVNYDFTKHRYNSEVAVENTTSEWGSIWSLSQIKGTTEYYYIVNRLRSCRSQALLREHIISEVNRLISRVGVKNSIQVKGLALSSDISEAISKLERGEIGFEEAMKATKS